MTLKIKIYCILLTIVYIAMLGSSVYNGRADFIKGFTEGRNTTLNTDYNVKVVPQSGKYTFIDSVENVKNHQPVNAEVSSCIIDFDASDSMPTYLKIIKVLLLIIFGILAIIVLFTPFLFFKLVYSATKGEIMTEGSIFSIRVLGYIILGFTVVEFFLNIIDNITIRQAVELKNYTILFEDPDYMTLVLGLVTIILGEVLRISMKLKEEQEFTI